jgi:hypothetical protein
MEPILYQLRDIHGPDPVSWWPPAPGWWLLAVGIVLSLWLLWKIIPLLRIPFVMELTWRWDASRQLRELRRRVRKEQDPKQSAAELSELLRRIAMARLGRNACAGLTGGDWLQWLQDNDPQNYTWTEQGALLLDLPYAPPGSASAERRQLMGLIDAAQNWIAREERKKAGGKHDV